MPKEPATPHPSKTALVVSGGGSRGAFAVGAIEVLRERGVDFDLVSGTSTGALIAPLVAIDRIDRLHAIYTSMRTRDILRPNLRGLFKKGLFESGPLHRLITRQVQELNLLRGIYTAPRRLFICTANLQTGRAEYWSSIPGPGVHHIYSEENLVDCLVASSNQPIFLPPVDLDDLHGGLHQHVDGGLREIAPLSIAIDHGARRLFVIVLSPDEAKPITTHLSWLLPIGLRSLDLMTQEIVTNDLKRAEEINALLAYLDRAETRAREHLPASDVDAIFTEDLPPFVHNKRPLEITVIRPERELTADGLHFDPAAMTQMLIQGRAAAERALADIPAAPNA